MVICGLIFQCGEKLLAIVDGWKWKGKLFIIAILLIIGSLSHCLSKDSTNKEK